MPFNRKSFGERHRCERGKSLPLARLPSSWSSPLESLPSSSSSELSTRRDKGLVSKCLNVERAPPCRRQLA